MAMFSVTRAMVKWLSSLGYDAHSRVPSPMPDQFVTVERTGGGVSSLIDRASIAVQVWDVDEHHDDRCEEAANAVRLALLTSNPPPGIGRVTVDSGPYPFFDQRTRRARYQLVLDVPCALTITD